MAKLVHLCTKCEHPESHHGRKGGQVPIAGCDCCRSARFDANPEPTITETFTHPGSQPEPLHEPGTVRNEGTSGQERLCGCDACRAIYAREAG